MSIKLGAHQVLNSFPGENFISGTNKIPRPLSHTLVKVDGARNNYYGGRTSYCWSGQSQTCVSHSHDQPMMMGFVTHRLNLHSYSIRVTRLDGTSFDIILPAISYQN